MMAVALKEREVEQDRMVQEHHEATRELINCILGIGETGRSRITLLIKKTGEDGRDNPKRL